MDQDEFHTTFIPTWCLNASDNNFLYVEDLPIHLPLIINDEDFIAEVEDHKSRRSFSRERWWVVKKSLQIYMQVEYEVFPFCEDGHQEKLMNQACVNIDEYLMKSTMNMEIIDKFQVREDETPVPHTLSCA